MWTSIQFKALLTSTVLLGIVSTTGCAGAPGDGSDDVEVTPQVTQVAPSGLSTSPLGIIDIDNCPDGAKVPAQRCALGILIDGSDSAR